MRMLRGQFIKAGSLSRPVPDDYIELEDIPVMRVRADLKGRGPPAAFDLLESRLPTLRGRRFYGTCLELPEGREYYACVALVDTDDPVKMQLEKGVISGGRYLRRKIHDWVKMVEAGEIPKQFDDMARVHPQEIYPTKQSVEFYRSQTELHLLLPVKKLGS